MWWKEKKREILGPTLRSFHPSGPHLRGCHASPGPTFIPLFGTPTRTTSLPNWPPHPTPKTKMWCWPNLVWPKFLTPSVAGIWPKLKNRTDGVCVCVCVCFFLFFLCFLFFLFFCFFIFLLLLFPLLSDLALHPLFILCWSQTPETPNP